MGRAEVGKVTSLPPRALSNPRTISHSLLFVGVLVGELQSCSACRSTRSKAGRVGTRSASRVSPASSSGGRTSFTASRPRKASIAAIDPCPSGGSESWNSMLDRFGPTEKLSCIGSGGPRSPLRSRHCCPGSRPERRGLRRRPEPGPALSHSLVGGRRPRTQPLIALLPL